MACLRWGQTRFQYAPVGVLRFENGCTARGGAWRRTTHGSVAGGGARRGRMRAGRKRACGCPPYKSVLKIFSFRKILSFLENIAKNKAAEAAKEEGGALTAHSYIRAVGKSAGVY